VPKRSVGFLCLVLLAMVLPTGCASIITGTTTSVTFTSEPPGAVVDVDGYMTTTPGTLRLSRAHTYTVFFKKEGYQSHTVEIRRTFNLWVLANLLTGYYLIFGVPIDLVTGGFWKLEHDRVHVILKREDTL